MEIRTGVEPTITLIDGRGEAEIVKPSGIEWSLSKQRDNLLKGERLSMRFWGEENLDTIALMSKRLRRDEDLVIRDLVAYHEIGPVEFGTPHLAARLPWLDGSSFKRLR